MRNYILSKQEKERGIELFRELDGDLNEATKKLFDDPNEKGSTVRGRALRKFWVEDHWKGIPGILSGKKPGILSGKDKTTNEDPNYEPQDINTIMDRITTWNEYMTDYKPSIYKKPYKEVDEDYIESWIQ